MPVVILMEGSQIAIGDKPDGGKIMHLIDKQSGVQVRIDLTEEGAKEVAGGLSGGIIIGKSMPKGSDKSMPKGSDE